MTELSTILRETCDGGVSWHDVQVSGSGPNLKCPLAGDCFGRACAFAERTEEITEGTKPVGEPGIEFAVVRTRESVWACSLATARPVVETERVVKRRTPTGEEIEAAREATERARALDRMRAKHCRAS